MVQRRQVQQAFSERRRRGVCCSALGQFSLLSSLMGQTIGSIHCNTSSVPCTCAIPIECPSPAALVAELHVARCSDHARSLLRNRPTQASCLLVSSRAAAHLRSLLASCILLHTFESDSTIGRAVRASGTCLTWNTRATTRPQWYHGGGRGPEGRGGPGEREGAPGAEESPGEMEGPPGAGPPENLQVRGKFLLSRKIPLVLLLSSYIVRAVFLFILLAAWGGEHLESTGFVKAAVLGSIRF